MPSVLSFKAVSSYRTRPRGTLFVSGMVPNGQGRRSAGEIG